MKKIMKYWAEHANYNGWHHLCAGLGIAWLVSLSWHYSIVALVLGIVFLVGVIADIIYVYSASRKIEV